MIEIWNTGSELDWGISDRGYHWDVLLSAGRRVWGVAADDGHGLQENGFGFVRVAAQKNVASILDALKKHGVQVTFFVVGHYLESAPDMVKKMVEEGHTVGNHTYHHPDMSKIADEESFKKEMDAVAESYREITGEEMAMYYRPPQGKFSFSNLQMAKDMGYKTFFWSLAYVDWDNDAQPTKEQAFAKLLPRIHNGAVVLLHSTSSTNAEILDELLTKWKDMGYTFGSVEELFT
jgi:peptidoglycan-N-acetylmuramic acid deacetylase